MTWQPRIFIGLRKKNGDSVFLMSNLPLLTVCKISWVPVEKLMQCFTNLCVGIVIITVEIYDVMFDFKNKRSMGFASFIL